MEITLLEQIADELTSIKSQLSENTQLTKAIFDRQDEKDAHVEARTLDVHKLHGELASLKRGQERQDKILESLAMRSLEQETDLRDLRRLQ
ncbi:MULTISPECIES: hypothetical protein [Sporosarcina]|uniref:Uncharacterized protein n=1 Tax=Sporosarcina newyorkensis TaxID=759851 RepID=A0A1T4Y1R4_9BACL|nr:MULTISPECIES: hypothetical protein [Sporosarcina]MBY0223481.1 hypothetical protein [Sporosarcina aquimarina]SKA95729.1 hypothetical protein SAMN04244570_1698 [Sporosarcina newyorkensis]